MEKTHWLYIKTIVDYWGIRYDVASVNIGIHWWTSRHIQYINSQ